MRLGLLLLPDGLFLSILESVTVSVLVENDVLSVEKYKINFSLKVKW